MVLSVVAVFVIAAALVGSEAFRLGHETPAAIFDLDEAVDAVGDGLSVEVQGRLTYDEVRALILATLEHLRSKGLGALPGEDVRTVTQSSPTSGGAQNEVVVRDDEALAVVLGAAEAQGLDVDDADAAHVIDGLLQHLDRIGALGPKA